MLTEQDRALLAKKGISEEQLNCQLHNFETGFPYLKLKAAASVENGILRPDDEAKESYVQIWKQYKQEGHNITKFVPASGAASRMFKAMFEFLDADYDVPTTEFEKKYFQNIEKFAFYQALDDACQVLEGKCISALIDEGNYKAVVAAMLDADGLNYGQLPKGLL